MYRTVNTLACTSVCRCYVPNYNLKSNPIIFTFHAVKEFLEKCKTEFEEKWNHPKHVS